LNECGCHAGEAKTRLERRAIGIALALNATMFVVGIAAGLVARSSALLADALDMLADSTAYGIALLAIGRAAAFKRHAALASGVILAILGVGVIADAIRRALVGGEPEGWIMALIALLSLIVNASVLKVLAPYRKGEVHLRAAWIFTRADVIANLGVISAAMLVIATNSGTPDLLVGAAIGLYVLKEATEILREARDA
jgi:cation diffusion facilitator family transporter